MALKKKITNENGVVTDYHKVDSINIRSMKDILNMRVVVKSYVSEDIRKKDKALSVAESVHNFLATVEEIEANSVYSIAYNSLKSTEMFAEAEDC